MIKLNKRVKVLLGVLRVIGIQSYIVGGAVRDYYLGIESDDIDICLTGVTSLKDIEPILSAHSDGMASNVGKSFSVTILTIDGQKYDFALARTEQSTGPRHQDVTVSVIGVSIAQDLVRRDLTINAMAFDTKTGELIDLFNSHQHLMNKVAHPTSDAFSNDPLRAVRAPRFISKYNLIPSKRLVELCTKADLTHLSAERIGGELEKMLKQAKNPSKFFHFLRKCNQLEHWFPEVHNMIGVQQDPVWHPEGDVYDHTMCTMDQATDPFIRMVMLCHDMGKVSTTEFIDGKWKAPGHAKEGVKPALALMKRLKFMNSSYQQSVTTLIYNHMFHTNTKFTPRAVKRCIRRLTPFATFEQLVEVCRCDVSGRPPLEPHTPYIGQDIAATAIIKNQIERVVTGKMLIEKGILPSRKMGAMLQLFEDKQDEELLSIDNWETFFNEFNHLT